MKPLAALSRAALVAALFISGGEFGRAQTYPGVAPPINAAAFPYQADPSGTIDSGTPIQNAINALPVSGGDVTLPCGVYKISTTLTLGNGSNGTASTRSGMRLIGQGGNSAQPQGSVVPCVRLLWAGGTSNFIVQVQGILQGWGIQNIVFDCGSVAGMTGLRNISGQWGRNENIGFVNCAGS